MLNEATKENLRRKSRWVDRVQLWNGVPLWSWVDLSLTELCNRTCVFCPRSDPSLYPNQKLHMSLDLVEKIAAELRGLEYQGAVVLCGYGEPTLYPDLTRAIKLLSGAPFNTAQNGGVKKDGVRVEMVTDGDFLTPNTIAEFRRAGLDYFVVSLYDGPHQVDRMHDLFLKANDIIGSAENTPTSNVQFGQTPDWYLIRDRWHNEDDDFGLKLTNRAGAITVGNQDPVDITHPCHYLAYQMTVDWNGDVLLCVQDWNKKVKLGNLSHETMMDVWTSQQMHSKRKRLIAGRRTDSPCNKCNTDGTLHGFNHVPEWRNWKRNNG